MANLQSLFHAMAAASDERKLRLAFMDNVGEHFGVQRWGIYLTDEQSRLVSVDVSGVPESLVERYEQVGRAVDPVMRYVVERHAPAHEELVLPPGGWKQCDLYQNCCAYYDHEHIMTGPIVGAGQLIGTVHFARTGHTPAFSSDHLADLSALCLHLSACLAMVMRSPQQFNSPLAHRLTPRERQIVELVAQGLTNAEIGAKLWITENSVKQALKRIFRKLEVVNRAEMVARSQSVLTA